MKKLDGGALIYLAILVLSWVVIIYYLVYIEREETIKKELKTYPFEHSRITDSTLKTNEHGDSIKRDGEPSEPLRRGR